MTAPDLFGVETESGDQAEGEDGPRARHLVSVAVAAPVPGPYDYLAPEPPREGAFVTAPLGGRETIGVVWGPGEGGVDPKKLKRVGQALDLPPMPPETRAFLEKAADYTLTPLGEMVRLATRAPGLAEPAPTRRALKRGPGGLQRPTAARRKALETFERLTRNQAGGVMAPADLARAAGVGAAVVAALVEDGALVETAAPRDPPYAPLDPERPHAELSSAQAEAAEALSAMVRARAFQPALLHGVTGSGKTEAYLEAVAECLRQGRQALVLLPEIALTDQFLARVERRFGARPAEWHSAVSGVERRRCWRAIASGQARLAVGARSALFLPFRDLGLIVVDEEHDGGYKQEEGAIYHARDMAVLRASFSKAAVILASATPSLETWANADAGRYAKVSLPERFGTAVEPEIAAIDLRREGLDRDRWISPSLARETAETLARGEQALLFLNRRGYAPLTLCRKCGARAGCPHCDAWLVEHRFSRKLVCHLCGHEESAHAVCRECGSDELAACGPGVERLEEEARARFPEARVSILSSDVATSAQALREKIDEIARGDADIVIGTQIVAKGHNFPNLTLVGVVDADLGLQGGDFRAAERTFQLIRQVAGRAGRAEKPGRALLQTVGPDLPVMRALIKGDELGFLEAEAAERRAAEAPPYGRYLAVIFSGPDEAKVWEIAQLFARESAPIRAAGADLLGPAPAPIPRIRGKARVRMLAVAPKGARLQEAARAWRARVKRLNGVRVVFDVDPMSFL
ncbi:MAG: primosomal protein N' [Pseudomonadota bacterium]